MRDEFLKNTLFFSILFLCIFSFSHAQESSENSPTKNSPVIKINTEKIAWDLMYPSNYKKHEKTAEMKSYEQLLLRMRSGTAELSLLIGEFEKRTRNKHNSEK